MASFRFLNLPNELRLKMYRFMLPRGERLHLDPELVLFPIPYIVEEDYGSTLNLLQVCKKIHAEATQFIYQHNTVNIIGTGRKGNFLQDLGLTACQYISKLECHVADGLADLGNIWATMKECPRLTDVRLVFYHERVNWCATFAQLAYYYQRNSAEDLPRLDLELHSSIWARHYSDYNYMDLMSASFAKAKRQVKVYTFEIPSQWRHITITASVHRVAGRSLAGWKTLAPEFGSNWGFVWVDSTMPDHMNTLRFEKQPASQSHETTTNNPERDLTRVEAHMNR